MKITAASVNVLLSLATLLPLNEAASLRAAFNSYFSSDEAVETSTKAQILIPGVLHDLSAEDLEIVASSAKKSYADTYGSSFKSIHSIKTQLHFDVPDGLVGGKQCHMCPPDDDAFLMLGQAKMVLAGIQLGSRQCHMCPPDDDAFVEEEDKESHKDKHDKFVSDFCHALSNSGSANLANAHECSFTFFEKNQVPVGPAVARDDSVDDDGNTLGFIALNGLVHDITASDRAVIQESAVKAYNDAFSSTLGYSLMSFNTRDAVEIPRATQCHMCPPDDDALSAVGMEVGKVVFVDLRVHAEQCHMCPPDDDALVLANGDEELQYLNRAFEKAFCSLLSKSSTGNFVNMNGCSFQIMFSPDSTSGKDIAPAKVAIAKKAKAHVKGEQCHMCPPDDDALEENKQ